MLVVRRAFRNYGQMMAPGSVVEPGTIKRYKSRLKDGHLIEVSEHDFDKWDEYFKARVGHGILLSQPENEQPENEQPENEQPENEPPENEPPENEQPETVKAVPDSNPGDKPKVVVKVK